jgi:hypothetical protein
VNSAPVGDDDRTQRRLEIATALLLSIAGLASAWASYQASLWGGTQAGHYARATAKATEASRLAIEDGQAVATDMLMFNEWASAAAEGDTARMAFYEHRFSPELHSKFDPWRLRHPGDLRQQRADPNAPASFPRPVHKAGIAATELQRTADAMFTKGDDANAIGDRYVATTVILSMVLFLAGISAPLKRPKVRALMLALAALLGIGAIAFILGLPVATL